MPSSKITVSMEPIPPGMEVKPFKKRPVNLPAELVMRLSILAAQRDMYIQDMVIDAIKATYPEIASENPGS